MRITNLMMQMNLASGLRARMAAMAKASTQATTGHRVNTVSDDPVDASEIMRMQSQVRDLEQFRRNGTFATTRLSTEDVALSSLRETLSSAKKLAMATNSADPNDPSRQAALSQALTLKDHMVALGNTQVGNQYLFGGDQSTIPPFTASGAYIGNQNTVRVEINGGVQLALNHAGQPLFTDALAAIDDLIQQLQTGTPGTIQASASALDAATEQALKTQADVGARLRDIQDTATQIAAQSSALLDRRDTLMNVDPTTAAVNLQQEQSALERAYAVVGRVLQTTLTDYLK